MTGHPAGDGHRSEEAALGEPVLEQRVGELRLRRGQPCLGLADEGAREGAVDAPPSSARGSARSPRRRGCARAWRGRGSRAARSRRATPSVRGAPAPPARALDGVRRPRRLVGDRDAARDEVPQVVREEHRPGRGWPRANARSGSSAAFPTSLPVRRKRSSRRPSGRAGAAGARPRPRARAGLEGSSNRRSISVGAEPENAYDATAVWCWSTLRRIPSAPSTRRRSWNSSNATRLRTPVRRAASRAGRGGGGGRSRRRCAGSTAAIAGRPRRGRGRPATHGRARRPCGGSCPGARGQNAPSVRTTMLDREHALEVDECRCPPRVRRRLRGRGGGGSSSRTAAGATARAACPPTASEKSLDASSSRSIISPGRSWPAMRNGFGVRFGHRPSLHDRRVFCLLEVVHSVCIVQTSRYARRVRVWIDVSNSPPQVPFFRPLIALLESRGHDIEVTTRDYAQTLELLALHSIPHEVVGPHGGARALAKVRAMAAGSARSDVMGAVARSTPRWPTPRTSFRSPRARSGSPPPTPSTTSSRACSTASAAGPRLRRRPRRDPAGAPGRARRPRPQRPSLSGPKEEYYLAGFAPDAAALEPARARPRPRPRRRPHSARGLALPPPRQPASPTCCRLGADQAVQAVVLPRTAEQRAEIERLALPSLVVPDRAVDARSLVALADLVVSAGGTMNREAVALAGVPVYTTFAGRVGAVDEMLVHAGRPVLTSPDDLPLRKAGRSRERVERDPVVLLDVLLGARALAPNVTSALGSPGQTQGGEMRKLAPALPPARSCSSWPS